MAKREVCKKCGWRSDPYPDHVMLAALGGIFSCPECRKAERNGPHIEGAYGSVSIERDKLTRFN